MASRFRFDPPRMELSPELAWVVARAFGPTEGADSRGHSWGPDRALKLAETLGVAARIGARNAPARISEELGGQAARSFVEASRQVAARNLIVAKLSEDLVAIGEELGIPTIFLKGAALLLGDRLQAGARAMADLDVLTGAEDAPRLQQRLKDGGWIEAVGIPGEHQLLMLTHRSGLGLEVHLVVLGVRITGAASASAEELLDGGLCTPLAGRSTGAAVPVDSALLAHLLVHGIAQHGLVPASYPMTRLIADAQDLCASRAQWDELLPDALKWIRSDVTAEEAEAVRDLALILSAGVDPASIAAADDRPGRLLRHILAGALDERYRDSLRIRALAHPLAVKSLSRKLARNVFYTVWLTRPQVDELYGKPRTTFGYWGWRLWRPFDLVLRSVKYGSAWVGHRLRKR